MQIHWEIVKKRGNHRPVLKYAIELEQFEKDLAVPRVLLEEGVPRPPSSWRSYCYPGEDERGGGAMERYRLMTPSHKDGKVSGSLVLPWRAQPDGFADVKAAFERLRHDFELALRSAYDSAPVELAEQVGLTEATRRHLVCGVAKARILSAVGF